MKPSSRPALGLGTRFLLIAGGVAVVGLSVCSVLILGLEQQLARANAEDVAVRLDRGIEASLSRAMEQNDWGMVSEILQAVAGSSSGMRIRVLGLQGSVLASSQPEEVGQNLDIGQPPCSSCHTSHAALPASSAVIPGVAGGDTLLHTSVVENSASCHACHDAAGARLGFLLVESSLASLEQRLAAGLGRIALAGGLTLLLMAGALFLAMQRSVVQPVRRLSEAAARVGSGNLDEAIGIAGRDEVGDLAAAFDGMRLRLKASREAVERNSQETSILYEVARSTGELLDLEEIYKRVLDAIVDRLSFQAGCLYLWDTETCRYVSRACRGISSEQLAEIETRRLEAGEFLTDRTGNSRRPFVVQDVALETRFQGIWDDPSGRSFVSVPLKSKERVIGRLDLITRAGHPVTDADLRVLEAAGLQIGTALENAYLHQQVRQLAVLEERDRLAREMHDNLSQALVYINWKTSITREQLLNDQVTDALAGLADLKEIVKETSTDVRESIFNLRDSSPLAVGFLAALREHLADYRRHYGLNVFLEVENDAPVNLPANASTQIARVIHEALSNVRKHAAATQACVRIGRINGGLRIVVEDDGAGFDPTTRVAARSGTFGLRIMQERVESVGGTLLVASGPGQGTRVVITMPDAPD